jgi:hypothetical protein
VEVSSVPGRRVLSLIAVVADGFDRAAFLGLFALGLFLRCAGLLIDKRVAAVIVPFEIIGSGFATEVAVDALVIDVKFTRDVFRIPVCNISHKFRRLSPLIYAVRDLKYQVSFGVFKRGYCADDSE